MLHVFQTYQRARVQRVRHGAQTRTPVLEHEWLQYKNTKTPTILICGHNSRDTRCGILGPILHAEFLSYVKGESQPQTNGDKVVEVRVENPILRSRVALISHIGGHAFAGNVIIYLPKFYKLPDGTVSPLAGKGIWYGRVEPKHVWGIMEETFRRGHVIEELLRGMYQPDDG